MKFLCDRCKTRYSIGDDRVRGKILKIRCKNCANVITVREGMTDADAAEPAGVRRPGKPTTMSPPIAAATPAAAPVSMGNGAPAGALGAAFATAMAKPPPALEEEWYVSIDGEQEGPFSLVDAQHWISAKAFDADLHCWSEGFDDWLPVDKVSHFRGLRKRPLPPAGPPPLPRATGGVPALRAAQQQVVEEEPKPLFAATMASLERSAPPSSSGVGMPAVGNNGAPRATPPGGQPRYPSPIGGTPAIQAKTNGSQTPAPIPKIGSSTGPSPKLGSSTGPAAKIPNIPSMTPAPIKAPAPLQPLKAPVPRAETRPGVGSAFDTGDSATQIDSPAFDLEAKTHAEPVASAKRSNSEGAFGRDDAPTEATPPANARLQSVPVDMGSDDDEDDGMEIGEVSRVVKLADLTRSAPPRKADPGLAAQPIARRTTSNPALGLARTGSVAKMGNTASVMRVDDSGFSPTGISADPSAVPGTEMAMAPAPAESHKRGMIILIGVAALLLVGVIVAVVMLAGGDDTVDKGLGKGDQIDTTRPDDPLRPRNPGDVAVGSNGSAAPQNPFFPTKNPGTRPKNPGTNPGTNPGNGSNKVDTSGELPTGDSLSPDDIDVVSKKYSTGTQRCYMRAQKGTDAITIGAVKSIQATLTVGKDGAVTDVLLASHADDNLGKCLVNALHGWRFRANPGGRIKFTLAFAQE